jgi:hypothetical protein
MGRIYSWQGDQQDQVEKMIQNSRIEEMNSSIDLLLTLFAGEFTKGKLQSYIAELELLKYQKGEKEYDRKEQILGYMKKILEALEAKPKK